MLTLRLWRLLHNSDLSNPLFQWTVARPRSRWPLALRWPEWRRPYWLIVLAALAVVTWINPLLLLVIVIIMPLVVLMTLVLLPLYTPLLINIIALMWAMDSSSTLARQRTLRRYDLISVSLDGNLNTSWVIASACAHRGYAFLLAFVFTWITLVIGLVSVAVLVVLGLLMLEQTSGVWLLLMLRTLADAAALMGGVYLHYIQTVILSLITGIYISTHLDSDFEAGLIAGLGFIAGQVGSFIAFVLLSHVILVPLDNSLFAAQSPAYVAMPFVYLLAFGLIREMLIAGIWYAINTRLNGQPADQDMLLSASEG